MLENTRLNQRAGERGNVLFLILIAVALFAALSYAVTQSSRSGGGDANNETSLINSAQITQYPSSVRTSIIRMMVSNNIDPDSLEFNPPSDFSNCTGAGNVPATHKQCVFHPDGGGATYTSGSSDVSADGNAQQWVYNGENQVNLVGTTAGAPSDTSAEIIAILPGVSKSVCDRINEQLGIEDDDGVTIVPEETGIDVSTQMLNGDGINSTAGAGGLIGDTGNADAKALNGQAFGCFQITGTYYYYHVLIEQ